MPAIATVSNALLVALFDSADDITQRTPISTLATLWHRRVDESGDPFLGLQIGATVPSGRFGLAARTAILGDNFRDVLERFAVLAPLVNELLECRLEGPALLVRFRWDVLDLERHAVDLVFAAAVTWARANLVEPCVVREVRLVHSRTEGNAVYEARFGAPIVFGAARNEIVFDEGTLASPVATRDPELRALLEHYARHELAKLPVSDGWPARIAQEIREQLVAGHPVELATVAARVGMSSRVLQRRLADQETTFSELLDRVRRELAPTWLAEPDAKVEHVGARLGYSEPTAFIRAFRKWYGTTPGASRRGAQSR